MDVIQDFDFPPIHKLPNEILDYIFSFLTINERVQTELVCKRWRSFGKTVTWRWPRQLVVIDGKDRFPFSTSNFVIRPENVPMVVPRCGPTLKLLTLRKPMVERSSLLESDEIIKIISAYCSNLVEFRGMHLADSVFCNLIECCSKLKSVSLLLRDMAFDDENLSSFFGRCKVLKTLRMTECYLLRGDFLAVINPDLKKLELVHCQFTDKSMQNLLGRCNGLRELCIITFPVLNNELLLNISSRFSSTLQVIRLDHPTQAIRWDEVLNNLGNIKVFSLTRSFGNLNRDFFKMLATRCRRLEVLDISENTIQDEALAELVAAPCLKVLRMNGVRGFTGPGLEVLAAQGFLEEVEATHNNVEMRLLREVLGMPSPSINFECLPRLCPNLRRLNVSGNKGVTNVLVAAFRDSIKLGFLKHPVQLIVEDTSIDYDVETCDNLEVIHEVATSFNWSSERWLHGHRACVI